MLSTFRHKNEIILNLCLSGPENGQQYERRAGDQRHVKGGIKTPRRINTINAYNAVSGKYDIPQLDNFGMTQTSVEFEGVNYVYFEYVWKGATIGANKYEIKTY